MEYVTVHTGKRKENSRIPGHDRQLPMMELNVLYIHEVTNARKVEES